MLTSFLIKWGSQIPFHIPIKHHTPSCTTNTTTEDFHSLHRSKVSKFDGIMEYDCMRDSSKRWKNYQDFPSYSILSYSRGFYLRRGKQKKPFFQYGYLPSAKVFLVYDPLCGVRWSVSMCVECDGPLECDDTPWVRCHMSMRGRKSPKRRILGHNSPNSTERMLVVVI